jgi:rhodanese-related sulfurtransferase
MSFAWPARLPIDFLSQIGYKNVRRYAGGLSDWEAAGLPLEGEAHE